VFLASLALSLSFAAQPAPVNPNGVANEQLSEHFALRWGDDLEFEDASRSEVLDGLELSWTVLIDELGCVAPRGTDETLMNVYLAGSGAGTPEAIGYAYASEGPEGLYIAINPIALDDPDGLAPSMAHELFHTIQSTTGSYGTAGPDWYWEATAEWASHVVYPDDPNAGLWMSPIVGLLPHLGIESTNPWSDPDDLSGYYPYAAGLFPIFLSDVIADDALIRDSWLAPSSPQDPLASLDTLLRERDTSTAEAFTELAARLATWDLDRGPELSAAAEGYAAAYPAQDHRVALRIDDAQARGARPSDELLPARYGFNVVDVDLARDSGMLDLVVTADALGSLGSPPDLRVVAVVVDGAQRRYFSGDHGERTSTVRVPATTGSTKLVVVAVGAAAGGERFGYAVDVVEVVDDDGRAPSAGLSEEHDVLARGCSGTAPATPAATLALLALLARRRRRSPIVRGAARTP
jgi:hypothetical protein